MDSTLPANASYSTTYTLNQNPYSFVYSTTRSFKIQIPLHYTLNQNPNLFAYNTTSTFNQNPNPFAYNITYTLNQNPNPFVYSTKYMFTQSKSHFICLPINVCSIKIPFIPFVYSTTHMLNRNPNPLPAAQHTSSIEIPIPCLQHNMLAVSTLQQKRMRFRNSSGPDEPRVRKAASLKYHQTHLYTC